MWPGHNAAFGLGTESRDGVSALTANTVPLLLKREEQLNRRSARSPFGTLRGADRFAC